MTSAHAFSNYASDDTEINSYNDFKQRERCFVLAGSTTR